MCRQSGFQREAPDWGIPIFSQQLFDLFQSIVQCLAMYIQDVGGVLFGLVFSQIHFQGFGQLGSVFPVVCQKRTDLGFHVLRQNGG